MESVDSALTTCGSGKCSTRFSSRKGSKKTVAKINKHSKAHRSKNLTGARNVLFGSHQPPPPPPPPAPRLGQVQNMLGVRGDAFLLQNLDWRSFGRQTYEDWVNAGFVERLGLKLSKFFASAGLVAARHVVPSSELPLSAKGYVNLYEKCLAMRDMLGKWKARYKSGECNMEVVKDSETMAASFTVGGARMLRHWLQGFILNGGVFKNVGYKRRSSRGILSDPAARTEMTWWMLTATSACPGTHQLAS
jgi:hypothetical protein